jgi:putative serine/threonine protein kinase
LPNTEKVMLKSLDEEKYRHVICYPKYEPEELKSRLEELERLKVTAVEFTGQKHIGDLGVLGKGHVGIVVKAYQEDKTVSLKIRRTDADRLTMHHEADMLQKANKVDVGPRLIEASRDFLLMGHVEGKLFPEWLKSLRWKDERERLRNVLRSALEQAWRLDEAGLDHGELSNAPRHIIVKVDNEPCLVDFETASTSRRVSNVTSLCQYLFLRSSTACLIGRILGGIEEDCLVNALRRYKREKNRENFLNVMVESKIQKSSTETNQTHNRISLGKK